MYGARERCSGFQASVSDDSNSIFVYESLDETENTEEEFEPENEYADDDEEKWTKLCLIDCPFHYALVWLWRRQGWLKERGNALSYRHKMLQTFGQILRI